jgi:adenosine deaminase
MSARKPATTGTLLVSTLGMSWPVVAEAYGFLAPDVLDLYQNHSLANRFASLRKDLGLGAPTEIWVVTTDSVETRKPQESLTRWWKLLPEPSRPALRVWKVAGLKDPDDQLECARMREVLFRVCLKAAECAPGRTVLCLAGGRKTMSADLQAAGDVFGAEALLHVLMGGSTASLPRLEPADLATPLKAEVANLITPVVVGRGHRADFLSYPRDGGEPVTSGAFDIRLPRGDGRPMAWSPPTDETDWLTHEIEARRREAAQLLGNYLGALSQKEKGDNWKTLYRLPVESIDFLQKTRIGPQHLDWLRRLPKADLHHHLGGSLDVAAQARVGSEVWKSLSKTQKTNARRAVGPLLRSATPWDYDWGRAWLNGRDRTACAAAILADLDPALLETHLFACTEPRRALKRRMPYGFDLYPRPGDLAGSTLLQDESAVEPYAQEVVAAARRHGLRLLELRGSPHKYLRGNGERFLELFRDAVQRAVALPGQPPIEVRFLVILSRARRDSPEEVVRLAIDAREKLGGFVAGIDLAGNESRGDVELLAPGFARAFEECFPVTIHAGEGEPAENIWKAAYVLHADRIGHGLTLASFPKLAPKFRFRKICVELCPTSNLEVVGFRDPEDASSRRWAKYPLRRLLDLGIPVTLCTDNPGISRTELAQEFVTASRLIGGLSLWDALGILKAGFRHAFLPPDTRDDLLREVDVELFRLLSDPGGLPPP